MAGATYAAAALALLSLTIGGAFPAAAQTVACGHDHAPAWQDASPYRETDATQAGQAFSRPSLGGAELRAPAPRGAPSPLRLGPARRRSIADVLREGVFVDRPEGGLAPLDLDEPIEELEAEGEFSLSEGRYELHENVYMRQGRTEFRSDALVYDTRLGYLEATGNVRLTQHESMLTADMVRYTLPPYGLEPLPPLEAAISVPARRQGILEAESFDLVEPGRQLQAGRLLYDFRDGSGELYDAKGNVDVFYFGAREVRLLSSDSADAEDVWVTTCDLDPPHYRIRLSELSMRESQPVFGRHARLQVGNQGTPIYWPSWRHSPRLDGGFSFDFDSGRAARLGYYVNFGQRVSLSPHVEAGFRFFPTEKQGVGFGLESAYNYTDLPASWLYGSEGAFRVLYTTKSRGHAEWRHRQDVAPDAVLLMQWEQWFDRDFFKDFYYNEYRNRTQPRTFANLTVTRPAYLVSGTIRATTNDWVTETERLPEASIHVFERPIAPGLYFSYDGIAGYNEREPTGASAGRLVNVARLSYDLELSDALNVVPFYELEATGYTRQRQKDDPAVLIANTVGATVQTRLHRAFPGRLGFESFRHIVLPSVTYSYRPSVTMNPENAPRFDAYDNAYGRSRLEAKIANVLFGRDAATGETWQVARLTFYAGGDFWNESRKSDDYEVELDVRPRPWWGVQMVAEHHSITGDRRFDEPFFLRRIFLEMYERYVGRPYDTEAAYQYDARFGDYDRALGYVYYDDTAMGGRFNSRIGFAYTKTLERVFNREIFYGAGYQIGEKWAVAFEHRYDFERNEITRQTYEVRRNLHCWEGALQFRERESGWDINVTFSLTAFPGTRISF